MENNGGFEKENVIGPINCSPVLPSVEIQLKRIVSSPMSRSVLKDSQKDNTLDSPEIEQFSKVSSTPLQHSADCKPPRNSWDEIRKLDEDELWIERTQVVTKEDHILYFEIAKEVVNSIIENLPVKSMENDNVESACVGLGENDADEAVNQAMIVFDEKKEEEVSDDQNVNGEDTLSPQLFDQPSEKSILEDNDFIQACSDTLSPQLFDQPSEKSILEDNDFIQACSDLDTTVKEILADEEPSSGEQLEDTQIDDLNSGAEKTICNDPTTELSDTIGDNDNFEIQIDEDSFKPANEGDTIGDNDNFEIQIDEDSFKPANEGAFALELDYLETICLNSDDTEHMSELSRQSLYVKFDPLVQARKNEKSKEESSVLASVNPADLLFSGPISASDLLVMDTPPNKQAESLRSENDLLGMDSPTKNPSQSLSALVNGGVEPSEVASTTAPVDQLFNYSPSKECITTDKLETDDRTESNSTVPEDDSALVQPLLYSKSDLDKAVAAAVAAIEEKLKTQWGEENAFHELEIKEHTTKIEKLVAEKNKALAEIHEIKTVMLEYEQTMAQMIEDREKIKSQHEKSNSETDQERNQLKNDLNNTEKSFAHLHKKFEKLKTAVEAYQKNEEILKKTVHDLQQHLKTSEGKYKLLKQHAESKIHEANVEIAKVKASNKTEVAALQAGVKREKARVSSLQQNLDQKIIENKELSAICDELINKVGTTAQ